MSYNKNSRNYHCKKKARIIEGTIPMACIFCEFMTSIEFDLDLHLYEEHRMELVKLPIGKGNMDTRIEYAIEEGKRFGNIIKDLDQQTREKLGFHNDDDGNSNSDLMVASQTKIGTNFILSHLAEPLFPRRVMTQKLGMQIKVFDRESILNQFQISDYNDCRINAYSYLSEENTPSSLYPRDEVRPVIKIIVIDLDLKNFNNSKEELDERLEKTLIKIRETIGGNPTVLHTGNGYHIYQPVSELSLDDIDIEKESVNTLDKYHLANQFLQFIEQYFTEGKSDPQHNPTLKSCLLRVPGTKNSKCRKEVGIIREWDYHRPSMHTLLPAFKNYLSLQQGIINKEINYMTSQSKNPTYLSEQNRYAWIDALLEIPIADYRQNAIWLILAPYLAVVKELPFEECFKIIKNWLNNCNSLKPIRFNANSFIKYKLRSAQRVRYRPVSFENLQRENEDLYNLIRKRMQK